MVVIDCEIVLWPARDHDLGILVVNAVDHLFRIIEACWVELESSPRVWHPVIPVHHDIVDRESALAETVECIKYLVL